MVDLNYLYGTVTAYAAGTGFPEPENPTNINDNNVGTYSLGRDGVLLGGGPWAQGWISDLGAARTVSAFLIPDGNSGQWVIEYSNVGTSGPWTTESSISQPSGGWTRTFTAPITARYWRLTKVHTVGGFQVGTGGVTAWETVEFVPPTCDSPLAFDVYSLGTATTPVLTYLDTLCDAFDKSFRVELDGTGSGKFSINRSSADATAAILGDGDGDVRYIKVRIPAIDTDAIFGFFLEDGDFRLLDSDEDGGETLTFSGHGSLAYLDFAVMLAHSYITNGMDPFTGLWRLYLAGTGSKPGQMLNRVITEAQDTDRPTVPLPLLTDTFDYTIDSNAAAWASSDATNEFSAQIGESVLSVVGRLIGTGAITVQMSPEFVLSAYNSFGTDRSNATFAAGKVRFVGGTNIAEGLTRQVRPSRVATHELVYGESETSVVASLADAASRVTREAYISASGTSTTALTAIGDADLAERQLRSESVSIRIALGSDDTTGLYLPGPSGSTAGKFWVGDTITLHTGTGEFDYNNASIVVAAINVVEGNAVAAVTDLEVTVELGSTALPSMAGSAGGTVGLTPASGGSLSASPGGGSSATPPHTHPSASVISAWKDPVRAASTGNLTLTAPGATIDGVTMAAQDRFLAKNQTTGSQNGIYIWLGAAATAVRAPDAASGATMLGATVHVTEGTVNADTVWSVTTNETITLDTTALTFAAFGPLTVEDEGTPLATRATTLDFVGAGVTASGAGAEKTITIPDSTITGVLISGTPTVGSIIAATSPTTAAWVPLAAVGVRYWPMLTLTSNP